MESTHKVDLKEIGLDVGLAVAKHFYKTDYLHYGFWTEGLTVEPANVLQAQENYAELLLNSIPAGVKRVLDVGCGSGKFAEKLMKHGYEVDCVSPSPHLTRYARNLLGPDVTIFECYYEDLQTDNTYDLILFSESFQYLKLSVAMQKTMERLNPSGHILICDFFSVPSDSKSPISGGHKLEHFYSVLPDYPIETKIDRDITAETAPSLDIMDRLFREVIHPIWNSAAYYTQHNYPWFARAFAWFFRKKIAKINRKYFGGGTSGASFLKHKSYRLFLFQKTA
jgi:SAM-dependent methyltransferase